MGLGILLIISALSIFIYDCYAEKKDYYKTWAFSRGLLCCLCTIIAIMIFSNIGTPEYPRAIDVYNGKTTLEITYRDSVPIDTIVVFK